MKETNDLREISPSSVHKKWKAAHDASSDFAHDASSDENYILESSDERKQPVNESRLLTSGALPMQEPQASQPSHLRRDGPREGWGS